MRRTSPVVAALLLGALGACVQPTANSSRPLPTDRIEVASLARKLQLDHERDALRQVEYLRNDSNDVLICGGMSTILVNGADLRLRQPVIVTSQGVLVPAEAEGLIRSRLVEPRRETPAPATPETPVRPSRPADWSTTAIPALPRTWRVRANRTWTSIVIHHSATERGGARAFDKEHREARGWQNGLGYHFVIGNGTDTPDGLVEVGPRWLRQNQGIHGAHAGSDLYNQHGIGICLVGNFEGDRPTAKQMAALVKLTQKLCERYGISTGKIYRHEQVRPQHTDCPGNRFPFSRFLADVRSGR